MVLSYPMAMPDYQIISVSEKKNAEKEGQMLDALEKLTREEVKTGWKPSGGVTWSPYNFVTETIHVSQVLYKLE